VNYLRPEVNQPVTVALKYPTPRPAKGFHGPELRWTLIDGRELYTPVEFSDKLEQLGIKAGQRFTIEKRKAGGGVEWHASHLSDLRGEQKAAQILRDAPALDEPDSSVPALAETTLERALKTAVSAAAQAEKHGAFVGYPVRFRPEDIRAMAITLLIGYQSGRAV
jgi:hypothetical protein